MAGTRDFISGILWGGLVGAAIGMLAAPRSGEETRALLRERSDEFRTQAKETAGNLREKATETAEQAKERAAKLQQRSREMLEENRERVVRTAEAVKRTAQEPTSTGSGQMPGMTGQGSRPQSGAGMGSPSGDVPAKPPTGPTRPPQSGGI
jgi:gas vesicle protein